MLVVLLACAGPGFALAAPPTPAPKPIVKPTASQDSVLRQTEASQAKAARAQGGTQTHRACADAGKQPYQPLVDTVRKSTETFRDENVSESADRDRLPDLPGR